MLIVLITLLLLAVFACDVFRLIVNCVIIYIGITVVPAILILIPWIIKKRKYKQYNAILEHLTKKEVLDQLDNEKKRQLAKLVDLYYTNYSQFVRQFKRFITGVATGYTIVNLGVDRTIRYGLGYVLIRRLLRKSTDDVL